MRARTLVTEGYLNGLPTSMTATGPTGRFDVAEYCRHIARQTFGFVSRDPFQGGEEGPVDIVTNNDSESWGGFVANLDHAGSYGNPNVWSDPAVLVGCIFGDGPDWLWYALNAIRKGRAVAREEKDLHLIRPAAFRTPTASAVARADRPGPDRRWGDFGLAPDKSVFGGAVIVGTGKNQVISGVSGYRWKHDWWAGAAFAGSLSNVLEEAS